LLSEQQSTGGKNANLSALEVFKLVRRFAVMFHRDLQQGRHQAAAQTVPEQNSQPDARGVETAGVLKEGGSLSLSLKTEDAQHI
jgi:hypothetical protein